MDYVIGLIDEEENHLSTIRRTLKLNKPSGDDRLDFKEYQLSGNRDILSQNVTREVLSDIIHCRISTLIIDYKIMIHSALVEGTDIYKAIKNIVPKFPVVILTDMPESCYSKDFVDADKVYWKKEFFKIDEDYSKEKTRNIFRNMERYIKQRAALSAMLEENLDIMANKGFSPELYKSIIEIEKNLDELTPQGQTTIDRTFKTDEIKETIELLEKAEKLLGDRNET